MIEIVNGNNNALSYQIILIMQVIFYNYLLNSYINMIFGYKSI